MEDQTRETQVAACTDCPAARASRRAFLRDVGAVVATLFAAGAAASPAAALASAVSETRATGVRGMLRTYALPSTDSISVDVDNEVILARWQNYVHAFSLKCPHRGARLEWHESEERIFCPKHKARFLADGSHDSGRRRATSIGTACRVRAARWSSISARSCAQTRMQVRGEQR